MKVSSEESVAYDYTMAEAFYKDKNADSIGRIIASDGSIWHGYRDGHHTMQSQGNYMYHKSWYDKLLKRISLNYPETKGFAFYKQNNTGFKIYSDTGVYDVIGRTKYSRVTCLLAACGVPAVRMEKE